MLWYKSWLETRWRFVIGLVVLLCSAAGVVMIYPRLAALMPSAMAADANSELGRRIRETAELSREFRGYIWVQWFRQNLVQTGTLFAILLGSGSVIAPGGSALFTLSLPVSRGRIARIRAAAGLAELFVIVFASSLVVPLMAPAVGEQYSVVNALVHGACAFLAAAAFFSFAFLVSSEFSDVWRPLGIAIAVAVALSLAEQILGAHTGIYAVMSGESYFRSGHLPWTGLLVSVVASMAMLYGAAVNLARRDF